MCLSPGPQLVVLFWKAVEHEGGGALLEEVSHWRRTFRLGSVALLPAESQLPGCGQEVTSHLVLRHCACPTMMGCVYP